MFDTIGRAVKQIMGAPSPSSKVGFGLNAASSGPNRIRITLEPGALSVTLYAHELIVCGVMLPSWTLVTDGLASVGQQELVLTVLRRGAARNSFPESVLGYIPAVKQFATEGRRVSQGGLSVYPAPGPFGLGEFVGLTFMDAIPMAGVELPRNCLAGIFLTEGELAMAQEIAVWRVLNKLGEQARYFPTP